MLTKLSGATRKSVVAAALVVGSGVGMLGCQQTEYERQRPPLDEVVRGDRGLQSKDVLIASDEIAAELLSLPELNDSDTQWALTIDRVEDRTTDRKFLRNDYQIFLERLRTNLSRQGRGRIALLENRDRLRDQQSRELDLPGSEIDEFEQGGEDPAPLPGRIQPRFILYAKASDLPNRATNYYYIDFIVTDIRSGRQVFVGDYEVRVSRR